ncbi:LysR substrate-binding domain-containing protein [Acidovorax sp. LjRoot129]|uniref:LysR substrate-binding domain-containing protein n=1 Tax=Acidovorax sp. LjRoot129 TaxID=3342260 RepID=UPI003ECC5D81
MEKSSPVLDLAALDIFRTVAAEGSVTRAAERLSRVQSNVTTRVQQLEADLGTPLFLREGRRMALTPEGEVLLGYADRLLALADEARQALRPGPPAGRLRLGSMESTAASRLPEPLARLHRQWPGVALELTTAPTRVLVERLRAHALDTVLVAWPPGQPPDPALETRPVFTEELLLVLPAGHTPVDGPQDVVPGTLAVFEPGCTYRRIAQEWFAPRPQPMQLLELGSYHAILASVAGGGCAGIVPRSVLSISPHAALLSQQPITTITTLLAWRQGYRSAALDALQQVLSD